MEAVNLQARFRIGIIGRLEAKLVYPHLRKEDFHEADQAAEGEAEVGDDAFDLVELGEVGRVDGFVAEDAVDGEVAGRVRVRGEFVQHVA